MRSPDASANDLMGVALEVNLKVGEGARLIRNFDKQKRKKEKEIRSYPNGYVLLPKKCVCV